MTVKELKEKLQSLPEDARVDIGIPVKVNATTNDISRKIDLFNYDDRNNVVRLSSFWTIQFFY